jgi:hypothetical protein
MDTGTSNGDVVVGARPGLAAPRVPWPLWAVGWTLLVTAALPVAWFAMAPIAGAYVWLSGLGAGLGLWAVPDGSLVQLWAMGTSLAVCVGAVQSLLLRRVVPRPSLWFAATAAGLLAVVFSAFVVVFVLPEAQVDALLSMAALLIGAGLLLGLAQWLCLRQWMKQSGWIVLIDLLAVSSVVLSGGTITSLLELIVILTLPGAISGFGMWLLVSGVAAEGERPLPPVDRNARILKTATRLALGGLVLVPVFFLGIWVYAASRLALAKLDGVYPTAREAVIAHSQGWGGAEVVEIANVHAGPNSANRQPHVWFGGATVYLDRVPEGGRRDYYVSGSFYIHVRDGWVHVPEGAFPEFIGWVMELYGMEGVGDTTAGG